MVIFDDFHQELADVLMCRATIEEKQTKMDTLVSKYAGFFNFVGISCVNVVMHPRMFVIGCKHNSRTTTYCSLGIFTRKFPKFVVVDYNRIITINNIIND